MRIDRLKQVREQLKLTQDELAEKIGVDSLQVWRWENGKNKPNADWIASLSEALSVSSDYLLGLTDEPNPAKMTVLSSKERAVIAAWRKGERFEAIKVIAGDE
jgi:transcriptional regulator with XRE-family HTH domain